MSRKIELLATAKEGKLIFLDSAVANAIIWTIKEGENVVVTIKRRYKNRTLNQNAYYWGVVLPPIAEHTGHTAEECHEAYKRMFLPPRIVEFGKMSFKMPGSSADLSTVEMTEFIEKIRAHAAVEFGMNIPDAYTE
ncbi:MAG: hypothetical protein WC530_09550 [Candidatus Omnitrophota bacterium]|jgi:hypothetical protein